MINRKKKRTALGGKEKNIYTENSGTFIVQKKVYTNTEKWEELMKVLQINIFFPLYKYRFKFIQNFVNLYIKKKQNETGLRIVPRITPCKFLQ